MLSSLLPISTLLKHQCTHAQFHTFIPAQAHPCMHAHIPTCTHNCSHSHMYAYKTVWKQTHTFFTHTKHAQSYTYTCVHAYMHTCMSLFIRMTSTFLIIYTTHMLKASSLWRPRLPVCPLHDTGSSCHFWWLSFWTGSCPGQGLFHK